MIGALLAVLVAADGSGQYRSVQEAVDAAPAHVHSRFVIHIKPGRYKERIVVPPEKPFLSFVGEDAQSTVLTYDLNWTALGGGPTRPQATFDTPSTSIQANDFTAENITFENSSGPHGQAVALAITGDRAVFRNCRFLGYQDTLLAQTGRQYFEGCYIEGAIDFIFGGSTAFFERCHIHAVHDGYVTAANTPRDQPRGYVFSHCTITGAPGVRTYLGRPWRPNASAAWVDTEMSEAVVSEGWNNWNDPAREKTARFAEHHSTGPGAARDSRVPWARQLTETEAAGLTAARVLAGIDGWDPATGSVRSAVRVVRATRTRAIAPRGPLRDPGIVQGPDGLFHVVRATGGKAFSHASSSDLIHWSAPKQVEIMARENALDVSSPRLFYDAAGRQFIVTWASTIARNYFQSFQDPVDRNPRLWFTTTADFETFADPRPFFDPNYPVSDGIILKDGARYALIHQDARRPVQALRVAFAASPLGPWGPSSDTFTEKSAAALGAVKVGVYWWIYYSSAATGRTEAARTLDFLTFTLTPVPGLPWKEPAATAVESPGGYR